MGSQCGGYLSGYKLSSKYLSLFTYLEQLEGVWTMTEFFYFGRYPFKCNVTYIPIYSISTSVYQPWGPLGGFNKRQRGPEVNFK